MENALSHDNGCIAYNVIYGVESRKCAMRIDRYTLDVHYKRSREVERANDEKSIISVGRCKRNFYENNNNNKTI